MEALQNVSSIADFIKIRNKIGYFVGGEYSSVES
jgi:hypothetical protein